MQCRSGRGGQERTGETHHAGSMGEKGTGQEHAQAQPVTHPLALEYRQLLIGCCQSRHLSSPQSNFIHGVVPAYPHSLLLTRNSSTFTCLLAVGQYTLTDSCSAYEPNMCYEYTLTDEHSWWLSRGSSPTQRHRIAKPTSHPDRWRCATKGFVCPRLIGWRIWLCNLCSRICRLAPWMGLTQCKRKN